MITARQLQIARQLHHRAKHLPPRQKIELEAAELQTVLNALFFALDEQTRLENQLERRLIHRAESRLTIFDPQPEAATPSA